MTPSQGHAPQLRQGPPPRGPFPGRPGRPPGLGGPGPYARATTPPGWAGPPGALAAATGRRRSPGSAAASRAVRASPASRSAYASARRSWTGPAAASGSFGWRASGGLAGRAGAASYICGCPTGASTALAAARTSASKIPYVVEFLYFISFLIEISVPGDREHVPESSRQAY